MIAYAPVEELILLFKDDALRAIRAQKNRNTIKGTVGPVKNFRLEYKIARKSEGPYRVSYELVKWEIVPLSEQGEKVSEAITSPSLFWSNLAGHPSLSSTITIWTYPDSFDDFRSLKSELYNKGYAVAARPLPESAFISGSPQGTISAAQ